MGSKSRRNKLKRLDNIYICLKECYETEYWLEVFVKSEIIDRDTAKDLYNQCGTIRRMLIASINTTKENLNKSV